MKRLPPLPALHTFLVTAQHCNFTRAAHHLHITQGAVSRQIAGLEEHLGYALFQRQARGLALTREGQDWLPRVQQIFALIEQGVREVGGRSATLQLKAPTCVMRWLLPRLLEWQALRPDVPVELTTTVQHGVDFRREGFDAAVVYGAAPNQGQQVRKLFDEQLTPVCAPSVSSGPLQLQDLARQMLLHPRGTNMTGGCGCRRPMPGSSPRGRSSISRRWTWPWPWPPKGRGSPLAISR